MSNPNDDWMLAWALIMAFSFVMLGVAIGTAITAVESDQGHSIIAFFELVIACIGFWVSWWMITREDPK